MIAKKHPEVIFTSSHKQDGNMSFVYGDATSVLQNRQQFLNTYGISLDQTVTTRVQNGTNIVHIGEDDLKRGMYAIDDGIPADGLITDQKGIYLFLIVADCLPLALYDPQHQAIGLFHAGWKGLVNGMVEKAVASMQQNFHSEPQQLVAEIGPSLCPRCYRPWIPQNSPEILLPYIKQSRQGDYTLDMWTFSQDHLKTAGLKNITIQGECSYHSGNYFSHRQFELEHLPQDSRFATVLGICK